MKRKGITIWEQYLERFVLGAAVLFFLGFATWQLMSQPNSVDRGKEGTVTPGEVDDLLSDRANQLQARLAPGTPAAFEIPDHQPVLDIFESQLAGSISPTQKLAVSDRRVIFSKGDLTGTDVVYVEPMVPAPYKVATEQYFDAIADEVVAESTALQAEFAAAPHDLTWITASALFDLKTVREQYQTAGPDGRAPIPPSWHLNRFDVLDVKVEREQYVDGVWTNRKMLEALPERTSVRAEIAGDLDRTKRDAVLDLMSQEGVQDEILRPEFYETANDSWTPPDPRIETLKVDESWTEEQQAIGRMEQALRKQISERDRKLAQLKEIGGSMDKDEGREEEKKEEEKPPPPPPGGAGGGSGPPGGGFGSAGGGGGEKRKVGKKRGAAGSGLGLTGGGGGGGVDEVAKKRTIERLKKRIRTLNKSIGVKERELAAPRGDDGKVEEIVQDDANMDEILVFAHDIHIEAGASYRYRFVVELYNPFWSKRRNLLEEQKHLADGITLVSASSDWSEPRQVIPDRKVFITRTFGPDNARNSGQVGMGQATAEVYRFYHGRWWRETFQIEPGDLVGAEKSVRNADASEPKVVDYGTKWFVLDIISDIDASRVDGERGYGATVLLQRVEDDTTVIGDPAKTRSDAERSWLKDAVELADLGGDLS